MAQGQVKDKNIVVSVVVGGRAIEGIRVNVNQRVEQLIREALREAGLAGANTDEWDLRNQGGQPIDRALRIGEAGIAEGATLYLDPREGGGGNVPVLVDPEISRRKLARQLEDWHANRAAYRSRGWFLVAQDELAVDVAFGARVPIGEPPGVPLLPVCIRIDFHNYDLWAPSVTFVDVLTGEPAPPAADALEHRPDGRPLRPGEPAERSLLPNHPATKLPFLCQQGIREYHEHPEHDGDSWLLHRASGRGTLSSICTQVWRLMTRNVVALAVEGAIGTEAGIGQLRFSLVQGDVDLIAEQRRAHEAAVAAGAVPGMAAVA